MYQQQSGQRLKMNVRASTNKARQQTTSNRRKVRPGNITGKIIQGKNIVRYTSIPRPITTGRNYQSMLNRYHKELKAYFHSLLHPEDAVNGSFIAKQPSFTAIPTSNVTFKEQIYFNTSASGEFNLIWVPNYFATDAAVVTRINDSNIYPYAYYSHLYYNNGTTGSPAEPAWFAHTSYTPAISLAKYRLVSAKLVVEYNGPIINKGGSLQSCAIYDDVNVAMLGSSKREENIPINFANLFTKNLNQFTDIELVRNGLWNRYVNMSNTSRGRIECLAVPSDPTDQTFFPMGAYYAKDPTQVASQVDSDNTKRCIYYSTSRDGGHLSFVIKGTGLTSNNNPVPMIATVYYNFEVIANQSTAPFLRATVSAEEWISILKNAGSAVLSAIKKINATGKTVTEDMILKQIPDIYLPGGQTLTFSKEYDL